MWEYNSFGEVIYMGNVQGPEKVNDACTKPMYAGTIDRGFNVFRNEDGDSNTSVPGSCIQQGECLTKSHMTIQQSALTSLAGRNRTL
jgi:hypothetical protein